MTSDARRRPRVMLGIMEVAGYYGNLARALRTLGVPATFVDLGEHPFRYDPESANWLVRTTRRALRRRVATPPGARLRRVAWLGVEGALRLALFSWAVTRFDAFVFGFGTTILGQPAFELRVLRLLGKRVIGVFHGSDARPPYLDGSIMAMDRRRSLAECIRLTRATKARVIAFERAAHWIVNNPLAGHFHERPFIHWLVIGIPFPPSERNAPIRIGGRSDAVRVLHSPSHPEAKGTGGIREAIGRLRDRGHAIEYVEVTGRPHGEILRELGHADIAIDQLYSDTPMAGFATEAAHFGIPAVVGSYAADELRRSVPEDVLPPTACCRPDALESTLERLIVDPEFRRRLGGRARAFVRGRWAPEAVAGRFLRLIEGDVPQEWLVDPSALRYVHGCALPEERVRALVAGVIAEGGRAALQVADKPELERALACLADADQPSSVRPAC